MKLRSKDIHDGAVWTCRNRIDKKQCGSQKSIRFESWFSSSKLTNGAATRQPTRRQPPPAKRTSKALLTDNGLTGCSWTVKLDNEIREEGESFDFDCDSCSSFFLLLEFNIDVSGHRCLAVDIASLFYALFHLNLQH
ncbi:hypothetical protein NPIL_654821 [Nephila pilipes]|uniref:Uncharacterized protein n=1 Tax=Nephila pilipes TaxID=299642 RepID=A0A8X6T3A6_NEPPI|nr:hypothetical protein NPIL_654821 [Nephila pilipes]